jgi:hypothetical protein
MLRPCTVWVDPGLMTGIAEYYRDSSLLIAREYPFHDACTMIGKLCRDLAGGQLAIGWERFTIGPQTHKLTPQHDALHVIGVLRWQSRLYGCHVLPEAQQASPSKAEQDQLRRLGWWVPGKNDAQSAAAHMLRWMRREGELPPRERDMLSAP